MPRKKSKYSATVVVPEKVLYTDNRGVSAVVSNRPLSDEVGLFVRYPAGWEFEEEDLPVATDRLKKGLANPVVLQALLMEAISKNKSYHEFGSIGNLFLAAGLSLLKMEDTYRLAVKGVTDENALKFIRGKLIEKQLTDTVKWEERMSGIFNNLDDFVKANPNFETDETITNILESIPVIDI